MAIIKYEGNLGKFSYDTEEYVIPGDDDGIRYIGKSNKPTYLEGCINYSWMFFNRKDLKYLNLEGWDTTNVQYMNSMFKDCSILEEIIGIENWNFSNLIYPNNMFTGCDILTLKKRLSFEIIEYNGPLGKFTYDTREYKIDNNIFYIGNSEQPSYLEGCIDYSYMFFLRADLEILDLSHWDMSKVKSIKRMFGGCINLKEIKGLKDCNLDNVIHIDGLFENCNKSLISDYSEWYNILTKVVESESLYDIENISKIDRANKFIPPSIISIGDIVSILYMYNNAINIYDYIVLDRELVYKYNKHSTIVKIIAIHPNRGILVEPLTNITDFKNIESFYIDKSNIYLYDIDMRINNISNIKELITCLKSLQGKEFIDLHIIKDVDITYKLSNVVLDENNNCLTLQATTDMPLVSINNILEFIEVTNNGYIKDDIKIYIEVFGLPREELLCSKIIDNEIHLYGNQKNII